MLALVLDLWHDRGHNGADFHTYLAAAIVGLQHGWSHIYDQALVAVEQTKLVSSQPSQPFISPPTVAWLVTPLTLFPFWTAFAVWAAFNFATLAVAFAWSGVSTGTMRWIAVIAALAPWWVLYAVNRGQVVPLVAAGVVVAWRLLREEEDIAAGIALSLVFLKPNTAILAPFALLAAGRYRAFAAWLAAGGVLALIAAVTLGSHGMSAYMNELGGPLPSGAAWLTLNGAVGATGIVASVLRVLIVGIVLVTAFKLRPSRGLVLPVAIVGSLIVAPYLHASDLCLLSAAAWIVWEERTSPAWRVPLAVGWILASPYVVVGGYSPYLNRWPLLEFILLLALVVVAWRPLTSAADLRTRAPA
jgi:Glycosyltransferase family 87